ncbi:Dynein heavy chain 11, axonemal [Aix galericulata]|nr:Dynein heavy chain 11, axonemal [Aix galericulata]
MTYALSFVEEKLGSKYVEGMRMDLAKSYEESSPATPVFFLLSPRVNPLEDIETLGKKLGFTTDSGSFHKISLRQEQEMVTEEALKTVTRGHWVLQKVSLTSHVFLSAEPVPTPEGHIIPHEILENSVKITNEPPMGILTYTLSSTILTRLRLGPPGWNQRYLFSTRDLSICLNVLCNYLETYTEGDILEMLPEEFNMAEIMWNDTARSPCTLVCLQECERMNLPFRHLKVS